MLDRVIFLVGLALMVVLVQETIQAPTGEQKCPYLANDVEYRFQQNEESGPKLEITYCRKGAATNRTRDEACSPDSGEYNLYFLDTFFNCNLPDLVHCNCDYKYRCEGVQTAEGLGFKCVALEDAQSAEVGADQMEGSQMMHLGDN